MNPQPSRGRFRTLLVTTVVVVGLVVVGLSIGWTLLKNPFGTETVDRSPPPVLLSLQKIAEFHAARGNFEVLVDVEKDVKYVPSVLAGERIVFMGTGSVDSYIDFSTLDERAIVVNEDATSVKLTVPAPLLSDPVVDPELSHVVESDKGLFDRLGDLVSGDQNSEQALYIAAAAKMTAAAEAAGLQAQAETATRDMLEGLMTGLGFEQIEIVFAPAPPRAE